MLITVTNALFGYDRAPWCALTTCTLHAGQCLGIFGPNGAGKTTLVRGITGLLKPLSGAVTRNHSTTDLRLAYMPQQRTMDLQWPMTALDAACMAISARRLFGWIGPATAQVRR